MFVDKKFLLKTIQSMNDEFFQELTSLLDLGAIASKKNSNCKNIKGKSDQLENQRTLGKSMTTGYTEKYMPWKTS